MDSSLVNKQIKTFILPVLREFGFSQFTSRTAWRYTIDRIDVINFQSFNSYLANSVGCTTYSFAVRLGCSFEAIPRMQRIKQKDGYLRPEEYECHFRLPLLKTIRQSNLKRRDIWYVDRSGENLRTVVEDARKAIQKNGMPWFHRFGDLKEVLRTLLEDSESHEGTHGFGTMQSPDRHFKTGFMALSLGKAQLAQEHLQNALDSGCFKEFESKIRDALEQTK